MNKLSKQVAAILAPRVGAIVANAMVEKQCKAISITPDGLTMDHLGALAEKIEHVLVIFGHDNTGVADKIRALRGL